MVQMHVAIDALKQAIREGAKGHELALNTLRERFAVVEGRPTYIQGRPLIMLAAGTKRLRNLQGHVRSVRRRILDTDLTMEA